MPKTCPECHGQMNSVETDSMGQIDQYECEQCHLRIRNVVQTEYRDYSAYVAISAIALTAYIYGPVALHIILLFFAGWLFVDLLEYGWKLYLID